MTPTPTKKEWCEHIVWERIYGLHAVTYGWWLSDDDMEVRPTWTLCPICGKERPKG